MYSDLFTSRQFFMPADEVMFSGCTWKAAVCGTFISSATFSPTIERANGIMKCTTSAHAMASVSLALLGAANAMPCDLMRLSKMGM